MVKWVEIQYTLFAMHNQVATVTNEVYSPLFFSLSLFLKVFFWGKNARGISLVKVIDGQYTLFATHNQVVTVTKCSILLPFSIIN